MKTNLPNSIRREIYGVQWEIVPPLWQPKFDKEDMNVKPIYRPITAYIVRNGVVQGKMTARLGEIIQEVERMAQLEYEYAKSCSKDGDVYIIVD